MKEKETNSKQEVGIALEALSEKYNRVEYRKVIKELKG